MNVKIIEVSNSNDLLYKLDGNYTIEKGQSEIVIHPDLVNSTTKELEEYINSFEKLD